MRRINRIGSALFSIVTIGALLMGVTSAAQAQPGPSVSVNYDFLPYQDFSDPIVMDDGTVIDNASVQLRKTRTALSYPMIFSEGRTVLVHELTYQLIDFRYREIQNPLRRLHSAGYTLIMQHQLSPKWSLLALGTPSLASDLGADVSEDDFSFQAAVVSIRHFSERFSMGFGAAYSSQFGSPMPLPVVAFDWNNGKNLTAKAILPVSFEFWYRPGSRIDLGLLVAGDGNSFRGDPTVYQVAHPELRYRMLTVGPAAKITLTPTVRLNVEAGLIGLHRFEFYDSDTEAYSYDLEPRQYVRVGLQFGQ